MNMREYEEMQAEKLLEPLIQEHGLDNIIEVTKQYLDSLQEDLDTCTYTSACDAITLFQLSAHIDKIWHQYCLLRRIRDKREQR